MSTKQDNGNDAAVLRPAAEPVSGRPAPTRFGDAGRPRIRSRGFSLLELLVTLGVVSVLLTVGVPGFLDIVGNNRAATNTNDLVTALSIARSEAIRRGVRISVCSSADGSSCGGTWQQGWIALVDVATDDADPPDVSEVLQRWPAPSGDPSVTGPAWVRYLPRGNAVTSAGTPVTYSLQLQSCSGLQARQIEVNAVGRTTVERVACP